MSDSDELRAGRKERIVGLIRRGASLSRAAKASRVDTSTIWKWAQEDPEFSTALEEAESEFVLEMTDLVVSAAREDWRAAVDLLKRRFPNEFSAVRKVEVTDSREEQQKRDEEIRTSLGYRRAILREAKSLGLVPDSVDAEILDEPAAPEGGWRMGEDEREEG